MLILIDESVLVKDFHMDSDCFKAIRKHGSITLCKIILDKVFVEYEKCHNADETSKYHDFISSFILDNGSVYPEGYPSLSVEEKNHKLANEPSYLFWKNCYDLYVHYVLEDIHIVTEKEEFFAKDSDLCSVIQADMEKRSSANQHNSLHIWHGIEDFYNGFMKAYSGEKITQEQILSEIQNDKLGFVEPLTNTVLSLMDTDSLPEKIRPIFEVSPTYNDICIDDIEIENVVDICGDIYTLEVCVECACTLRTDNISNDFEKDEECEIRTVCGADGKIYAEYDKEMYICCILIYDISKRTTVKCELDYIDDGSCNFC